MSENNQKIEQKDRKVPIYMKKSLCPHEFPSKMKNTWKYDLFARWSAIQALGTRFTLKQRRQIALTEDEDELLLACKDQNEFAAYVKISVGSLCNWKANFRENFNLRKLWYCDQWLGDRAPVVFQSWVAGVASRKSADLIKLYLQYQMKWVPMEKHDLGGNVSITFETAKSGDKPKGIRYKE